ncbi:MAG: hypothetical protein QM756_03400 [Polyangiaceae bacterium]
MSEADSAPPAAWLSGPRFDVLSVFAPAVLVFAVFAACVSLGASPLPFLWLWLACFDGPHMFATYSRVYSDGELWRTRPRLLWGSLLAFAVGPAWLGLAALLRAPGLFTAFLALMSVYSYFHVVRQHWGFAALYGARSSARATQAERWLLYAACWLPYVAFVATHPAITGQAQLPASTLALRSLLRVICGAGYLAALGLLLLGLVRSIAARQPPQKSAYLLLAAAFHGLVYLLVAGYEPVFRGAVGLDQQFMLLSVMTGVFHSSQYVALVGLYHARTGSGLARWFTERPLRWLLLVAPFVAVYLIVACGTSVYPGCQAWLGQAEGSLTGSQLALGLWWGFALHHYWLDERVWHVRRDARLRQAFGLGVNTT